MEHAIKPLGEYWVLDNIITKKVKMMQVNQRGRLSLQYHYRSEVWRNISGVGIITIDDKTMECQPDEVTLIPQGSIHRIENKYENPLIFIGIHNRSYFGGDDIVRIGDDYSRVKFQG